MQTAWVHVGPIYAYTGHKQYSGLSRSHTRNGMCDLYFVNVECVGVKSAWMYVCRPM